MVYSDDRILALIDSTLFGSAATALVVCEKGVYWHNKEVSIVPDGVSIVDGKVVGVGTPEYAAPEQFTGGDITPAADIHALGVLTEKLLGDQTRQHKWGSGALAASAWKRIVRRATSSIASERYQSVDAFAAAIRRRHWLRNAAWTCLVGLSLAIIGFAVANLPRSILDLYRQDIWKHAGGLAAKVERIFDEIPDQLSKHKKKFKVSALEESAKMRDYADSFRWLESAMFVNLAWNSTEPNVGLKLNLNRQSVKCYMSDTGLLVSHAFDENALATAEIHRRILLDRIELNKGMLVENMAAQMLTAAGRKLYFHSETNPNVAEDRMEIDFLVAKSKLTALHNVSPIEIKGGDNITHSSLDKYRRKFAEWCGESFLFYDKDVQMKDGITYLPHYMLPCLG